MNLPAQENPVPSQEPGKVLNLEVHPRVLVVDDDFVNRKIWEEVLTAKCKVAFAESGEEALKVYQSFHPNLVVLDRMMPGLHGDEVMAKIREMDKHGDTKIVMHSMLESKNDQMDGMHKGADLYIPKSTDIDIAVTQVQSLLRLQKSDQSTTLFKIARDQNRQGGFASRFIAENIYRHASLLSDDIRATRVDIQRVLKNVVETMTNGTDFVQINLKHGPETYIIMGDDDLLNHAFYTVIKRAIHVSPRNTDINIELLEKAEEVRIIIQDEGSRIPATEWNHIFHFECDDEKIQVGLPIAWETAQRHLGDLEISEGAVGMKFTFRFPTPEKLKIMTNS